MTRTAAIVRSGGDEPAVTAEIVANPRPRAASRERRLLAAAIAAWVIVVGAGMGALLQYANTTGDAGAPPSKWPAAAAVAPVEGRATLVMLAHPHCPCTRASLDELAIVMSRALDQPAAHVVFAAPEADDDAWRDADLVKKAASIPGVRVHFDDSGRHAALFQAKTSGHVVVYDARGDLVYSGGITAARGHAGDNAGRERLLAIIAGRPADRAESAVFGCGLAGSDPVNPEAAR